MKLIEFKEYNNSNGKVLNKRKVAITMAIVVIIIVVMMFTLLYICSPKFRNWADMHVLMKTVNQGSLPSIDIDMEENVSIYAYDKYVALLNNNKLDIYNTSAKKVESIEVNISNPLFESNGKYAAIAEKEKQKVYLVSGTRKLWSRDVEGSISRLSVNENGYVSIVCSGTTYKSVIVVFDQDGNELFKMYIPNNKVVDCAISSDNKYLSFAEIDTNGTLVKSIVKTVSMKEASESSEGSAVYTYEMPTNVLVVNIRYQGSKNLICMCDSEIDILSAGEIKQLYNLKDEQKKYTFAGIDMINSIYQLEEISEGLSNQMTNINIMNTGTRKLHNYSISSIAKSTVSSGDVIAVNLGTEIYYIDTKGWLKKKFVATEEVRDIAVSERVSAIIFRDHIEILVY